MYLAIDIGGTKTLIVLFSTRGRQIARTRFLTAKDETAFLAELKQHLQPFAKYPVTRIVLAVPGHFSAAQPQVEQKICSTFAPVSSASMPHIIYGNLPWDDPDLITPLKTLFPAAQLNIQNDADLATLYEASFYPGTLCYLTFSTGIGGGLATDGQLIPASANFEPGHEFYYFAGDYLEWEDFAAMSAIREAYHDLPATKLRGKTIMEDIALRLCAGLAPIIKDLTPDIIVIGGPLALIFRRFKTALTAALSDALPDQPLPRLLPAKKPTESVIYGAYLYAKRSS